MTFKEQNPREIIGGNFPPIKDRLPLDYGHLVEEVEALADRANSAPIEVADDIDHGITQSWMPGRTAPSKMRNKGPKNEPRSIVRKRTTTSRPRRQRHRKSDGCFGKNGRVDI
jgi:hypothetical protein